MEEYSYKIVLIGETGTGAKTSLINRLYKNEFHKIIMGTTGAYFVNIFIQIKLGIIKLQLWDTSGQEKFREINKVFIKGSHCIILGYDITLKNTFDEIQKYHYNRIKYITGDESLIYLVANKIDLIKNIED